MCHVCWVSVQCLSWHFVTLLPSSGFRIHQYSPPRVSARSRRCWKPCINHPPGVPGGQHSHWQSIVLRMWWRVAETGVPAGCKGCSAHLRTSSVLSALCVAPANLLTTVVSLPTLVLGYLRSQTLHSRRWPNVISLLSQLLRRWPNNEITFVSWIVVSNKCKRLNQCSFKVDPQSTTLAQH